MTQDQSCKRVLLASTQSCSVVYCEDCRVAEVNVGAISLRLDIEAVQDVQAVLQAALLRLSQLNAGNTQNHVDVVPAQVH